MSYTLKEGWTAEVEPEEEEGKSKVTIKRGETLFAIYHVAHYPDENPIIVVAALCPAAFADVE
jgi:hypothetical protein